MTPRIVALALALLIVSWVQPVMAAVETESPSESARSLGLDAMGPASAEHREVTTWLPFSSILFGLLVPLVDDSELLVLEVEAEEGDADALFVLGLAKLRGEVFHTGNDRIDTGLAMLA